MPTREELMEAVAKKRQRQELEEAVIAKRANEPQEATAGEKGQAALTGFSKSATFGYLPEMQAAVATGIDTLTGQEGSYDENLQSFRSLADRQEAKAPGYSLAGEVAGFAVPGMGISKGIKAGAAALKAPRMAKAAKAGTIAEKAKELEAGRSGLGYTAEKFLAGAAGEGGLMQQAVSLGSVGAAESFLYNPEEGASRMSAATSGGLFGAAIPPALKTAGKVAGAVGGFAKGAGKSAISIMAQADRAEVDKYLNNPKIIRNAMSFGSLDEAITDLVGPIRRDLADANIDFAEAKQRANRIKDEIVSNFADEDKAIKKAFDKANETLKKEYADSYDQLNKVKAPEYLTDPISESITQLRKNVFKGSDMALDTLMREAPAELDINGAATVADDFLEGLTVNGKIPVDSQSAATAITQLRDEIASFGGIMSPYDIKKYVKNLDKTIDIAESQARRGVVPVDIQARVAVRQYLDKAMKEASPGYAAAMEAVANDASLLSQARREFGNTNKTVRALNSIDNKLNANKREILARLGERTGRDYSEDLFEYIEVKNQLKKLGTRNVGDLGLISDEKLDYVRNLDSWADFEKAKIHLAAVQNRSKIAKKDAIEKSFRESEAAKALEIAELKKQRAQEANDIIKGFDETTSEKKIEQLIQVLNAGKEGRGVGIRKQFDYLSQMSPLDFEKEIEAMATKEMFQSTFDLRGKDANIFAAIGSAVLTGGGAARTGSGALFGGLMGGPTGALMGASLGAWMEIYGPKTAQKILDQVIAIKGLPSRQKIINLDLPPQVRKDLLLQFEVFALTAWAGQSVKVEDDDIPLVRDDIRRNDELTESQKAKAISSLNRSGEIKNPEMVFGKVEPSNPGEEYRQAKGY